MLTFRSCRGLFLSLLLIASACSSTSAGTGSNGTDAGGSASQSTDGGDDSGEESPVTIANLSYVSTDEMTTVTFVVKNGSSMVIKTIRSIKVFFMGTQVATWDALGTECASWQLLPGGTSSVLTIALSGSANVAEDFGAATVTCRGTDSANGKRPEATMSVIGHGEVKVEVNGILEDATPFLASSTASP